MHKRHTYSINEDFFEVWSPKMAWVLGIVYTDGCIYSNLKSYVLEISMKDRDVLEKVKKAMNATQKIYFRKNNRGYNKNGTIFRLTIYGKKIYEDLVNLGVMPRKSRIISFPKIPIKYLSHFVRGIIDGDGSISKNKYTYYVDISSGSKKFINGLRNTLGKLGFKSSVRKGKAVNYAVFWGYKFLRWIYDGKGEYFMERKFRRIAYDCYKKD